MMKEINIEMIDKYGRKKLRKACNMCLNVLFDAILKRYARCEGILQVL